MNRYVVASSKEWFGDYSKSIEYKNLNIIEVKKKEDLTYENLKKIKPRYIFFPHWSWRVDSEIYENFECVVFHTAPLPYGRGGSPIQNLIIRGIEKSPVCALKMTEVLDGGPIYDFIEIKLDGNIEDIFIRISECIERMIIKICNENPTPINQSGEVYSFNRLSYSDNKILDSFELREIYDRIRMVDGGGYKRSFIEFGQYRIEFSNATYNGDNLIALATFYLKS